MGRWQQIAADNAAERERRRDRAVWRRLLSCFSAAAIIAMAWIGLIALLVRPFWHD